MTDLQYTIKPWTPSYRSDPFRSSPTKYVATIRDYQGQWKGETGKCATRHGAREAAKRLIAKLQDNFVQDFGVDQLLAGEIL